MKHLKKLSLKIKNKKQYFFPKLSYMVLAHQNMQIIESLVKKSWI